MNKHFDNKSAKREALEKARSEYNLDKQAWLKENAEAIKAKNKWVEENGIPFQGARYKPDFTK